MSALSVQKSSYWENRKDSIYLFAAREICRRYCPTPNAVIDVGSNQTPTLEWHRETAERLVSVDLRRPYVADHVESVVCDFLEYRTDQKFDLATCFQVLEHIGDPEPFAQKLLEIGNTVIVSVPYRWQKRKCKYHLHDPVDRKKMLTWFGREPRFTYVATELHKVQRLIHVYE
jgi:hypothetical protein